MTSGNSPRKPDWLKIRIPSGENVRRVNQLLKKERLCTVCEEARCPNMHDCWHRGTATFMILGDTCTRSCRFCNVKTGRPGIIDWGEAERVVSAAEQMKLKHVVITSVDRDELPDGGAGLFALVLHLFHQRLPEVTVEVLIPDFKGDRACLQLVLNERPDVLNHNIETVPRLYSDVRPQADYKQSLTLLERSVKAGFYTKSGMMVGLGETDDEVKDTLRDLAAVGVSFVTIGQYLQPRRDLHDVERYVHPDVFNEYADFGRSIGIERMQSGPLVRSSYHADEAMHSEGPVSK